MSGLLGGEFGLGDWRMIELEARTAGVASSFRLGQLQFDVAKAGRR